MPEYPEEFLERCRAVTNKRAKVVIDHILEHGHVTTEELRTLYGYGHPPRAPGDVKDAHIVIRTDMDMNRASDGRKMATYLFDVEATLLLSPLTGRTVLGKKLKAALVKANGSRCAIYGTPFPESELQIDHRVPYLVAGDPEGELDVKDFMLLCRSANRAKSWACEHCENGISLKEPATCRTCYWGSPENYTHVAMQQMRRLDLMWQGEETKTYDELLKAARESTLDLPAYVRVVLKQEMRARKEREGLP